MATRGYWKGSLSARLSRRRALAVSGASGAAILLAACGGKTNNGGSAAPGGGNSSLISTASDTSKQAKRGGTSKFYNTADAATFDVNQAIAPLEVPQGHVYSRLTQEKAGHLSAPTFDIVPDL